MSAEYHISKRVQQQSGKYEWEFWEGPYKKKSKAIKVLKTDYGDVKDFAVRRSETTTVLRGTKKGPLEL